MDNFLLVIRALSIPFLGTSLGAASVFFMRGEMNLPLQRALAGFAAGVMVAASVWSLLLPAIDRAALTMGSGAFFPAVAGLLLGFAFLMLLDRIVPPLHVQSEEAEGPKSRLRKTSMTVLAVTIHNLPEGMAVGVVVAGYISGGSGISAAAVLALSLGIGIQNFPEGAIVSLPLSCGKTGKGKAFAKGVLSGAVEPIGALLTVLMTGLVVPALPYLLAFAAGAMLFVVVEELVPGMTENERSSIGTVFFAVGFSLMMALDVALG